MDRAQEHTVKPSTRAITIPLIDMKPSDPDSTITVMIVPEEDPTVIKIMHC